MNEPKREKRVGMEQVNITCSDNFSHVGQHEHNLKTVFTVS